MIRLLRVILLLLIGIALAVILFKLRTPESTPQTRSEALGELNDLSTPERRLLEPGEDFSPLGKPKAYEWLAIVPEPGQSWHKFAKSGFPWPESGRHTLYLQPFGEFPPDRSPPLEALRAWTEAWFMLPAKLLPPLDVTSASLTNRINGSATQYLTRDIVDQAVRGMPQDGYLLLVVTMHDLYPDSGWNFVFGEAHLAKRVGVFSFARYHPSFYGEKHVANLASSGTADVTNLILRRSCAVLAHEAGHLFGMAHCIYYCCLMNGSNSLYESDSRPMHECPICLRKLQTAIGFDGRARYRALRELCRSYGFTKEVAWLDSRLDHIGPQ
ncbi:MAG: hypothetical protein HQM09_21165 [Candidatus Riflebacteria bacterium]|nr:hypothetical protein [Candidatus Riflebacteria bacterium]